MDFSPKAKRILGIILLILATIALAYLLYVVFFRPPEEIPPANVNGQPVGGIFPNINRAPTNVNGNVNITPGIPRIDPIALGGYTQTHILTPGTNAQHPRIDHNGNLRYYDPDDGKFYRVDGNGDITQLGNAQFRDAQNITWAPTTNEVIVEFPDGANVYYNLDTGRQVTLPKEYEEFDFSTTSGNIAFKYAHIDPDRRVLAVADPDGTNARTLEPLGYYGYRVTVKWSPTSRVAATWSEFTGLERQEVGFLGLQNENFKGMVVEGRGLHYQYTPDGKEMLYSVYSEGTKYNPGLWIVEADGENIGNHRRELNVTTSADKCAFASDGNTVYCGVPANPVDGFGVAPDLNRNVTDELYRLDVRTGAKTRIAIPVNSSGNATYVIEQPTLSSDGREFYFRDAKSGELVKVQLQ